MSAERFAGLETIAAKVEELRDHGYLIVFKVAPEDWPFMGMDGTIVESKCLVELYPFGRNVTAPYGVRATGLGNTLVEAFLAAYKQWGVQAGKAASRL
jgi:hypothetical protein